MIGRFGKIVAALAMTFLAGLLVGAGIVHYRTLPYVALISSPHLAKIADLTKGRSTPPAPPPSTEAPYNEQAFLAYGFAEALVAPEAQILPPIHSLEEMASQLKGWVTDARRFPAAFARLQLGRAVRRDSLLLLDYVLDKPSQAAAYAVPMRGGEAECAILVIPGSGENQAYEMFRGNPENYQKNIVDIGAGYCDVFIQIKRNDSLYALHNGQRRLRDSYVYNYLINRGGSYSALYLTDALAMAKHLKNAYRRLVVAGLSQGGLAALLVASQANPQGLIAASGYTVLLDFLEPGNADQIVLPGLWQELYSQESIARWFSSTETKVLLTYGQEERNLYGIDAAENRTCQRFTQFSNVSCAIHGGGHEYVEPLVRRFLEGP
jgi:hypothetical protein